MGAMCAWWVVFLIATVAVAEAADAFDELRQLMLRDGAWLPANISPVRSANDTGMCLTDDDILAVAGQVQYVEFRIPRKRWTICSTTPHRLRDKVAHEIAKGNASQYATWFTYLPHPSRESNVIEWSESKVVEQLGSSRLAGRILAHQRAMQRAWKRQRQHSVPWDVFVLADYWVRSRSFGLTGSGSCCCLVAWIDFTNHAERDEQREAFSAWNWLKDDGDEEFVQVRSRLVRQRRLSSSSSSVCKEEYTFRYHHHRLSMETSLLDYGFVDESSTEQRVRIDGIVLLRQAPSPLRLFWQFSRRGEAEVRQAFERCASRLAAWWPEGGGGRLLFPLARQYHDMQSRIVRESLECCQRMMAVCRRHRPGGWRALLFERCPT